MNEITGQRCKILVTILVTILFGNFLARGAISAESNRLNILLIVTDDQRPDTIQALGNPHIRTPNLDQLAREGTVFTRAMTAVPICVASRAELLSGCDGLKNGLNDWGFGIRRNGPRWASTMRDAGYHTCYVGKWHTAGKPVDHGYAAVEGLYLGGGAAWMPKDAVDWKGLPVTGYRGWIFQDAEGKKFPERGVGLTPKISTDFADAAIKVVRETRDKPFFLHVNFTAPHDPLLRPPGDEFAYDPNKLPLPKNFLPQHPFDHGNVTGRDELLFGSPRTRHETLGELAVYYSVISHLDAQVGRLLKALDESGQRERTLVVFTSDHGVAIGSHGLRGKQNMYEHSIGVPLIFRGPGVPVGEKRTAPCYLRDLFPTACHAAGIETPLTIDGKSQWPTITTQAPAVYTHVFSHFQDKSRMVRGKRWKLIAYPIAEREQLFDLENDPDEINNLIAEPNHRSIADDLRARLRSWREANGDSTLRK